MEDSALSGPIKVKKTLVFIHCCCFYIQD